VNVTCSQCGKRYALPDDRVAGKASVKIRCKQCSNVMTVQIAPVSSSPSQSGRVPNEASPWDSESTKAMPSLNPDDTWFAMLSGQQVGPMGIAELQEKVSQGIANLRTYLWKPSMADWKRAADVPELAQLFAVGTSMTRLPPAVSEPKMSPAPAGAVASSTSGLRSAPRSSLSPKPAVSPEALFDEPDSQAAVTALARPSLTTSPSSSNSGIVKNSAAAPLSDLFGDVSQESEVSNDSEPTVVKKPIDAPKTDPSAADPFAALSKDDGLEPPKPNETTNFFIAKSGARNRNPPWKIALAIISLFGVPAAILYMASTFQWLKPITVVNENGEEVQQPFFSAEGVSGLADMLTGKAKQKAAEAAAKRAAKEKEEQERLAAETKKKTPSGSAGPASEKSNVADSNIGQAVGGDPFASVKVDKATMAELYKEDGEKKGAVPKNRQEASGSSAQVNTAGLTDEVSSKVVRDKMKSFEACQDAALRRNPNFAVGSFTVVIDVGASGTVTQASVVPKKYEGSDWAQCITSAAKRIVFPRAEGASEVQVPLKFGNPTM
jgi:hypothetical protein